MANLPKKTNLGKRRRRSHDDVHDDDVRAQMGSAKRKHRDTTDMLLEDIHNRLDKLGSQRGQTVEPSLDKLATFLIDKMDKNKKDIFGILMKSLQHHPMQSAAYATLVGLINVERFEFGGEALQFTVLHLLEQMRTGDWETTRSLLWLLAGMVNVNVITAGSFLQFLNFLMKPCIMVKKEESLNIKRELLDEREMTELTSKQQSDTGLQRRHDWLVYTVLSCLPLVGHELNEKKESAFNALLDAIQLYVNKTTQRRNLCAPFLRVWNSGDPLQVECLDVLWQQIHHLHNDGWMDKYQLLQRPFIAFDSRLSEALNHKLPQFETPDPIPVCDSTTPSPLSSWMVFRIFDFQETGLNDEAQYLPDAFSIERHLIDGELNEIFKLHHLNAKKCAHLLIEFAQSKPDIAIRHCIVECLLGKMLQLPLDQMDQKVMTINCGAILIELSKLQPNIMPGIIRESVDIFYRKMPTMNVMCFDRFVNWFSHYLSNFRYEWNWHEWNINSILPPNCLNENTQRHPTIIFVRELIKKLLRLSYYERIEQVLPEQMIQFMGVAPLPKFKYMNKMLSGSTLANDLLIALRHKSSPSIVVHILETNKSVGDLCKIDVLMQCIAHLGCKSFTHVFLLFSKYLSELKYLASSENAQHAMLNAIYEIWIHNDQLKLVLTEKLLRLGIIDAKYIISWFFAPAQKNELTKIYVWELIHVTMRFIKSPPTNNAKTTATSAMAIMDIDMDVDTEKTLRFLLLDVVQRFFKILSLHQQTRRFATNETGGREQLVPDYWHDWVMGRFQEFLFIYLLDFRKLRDNLKNIAEKAEECHSFAKVIHTFISFNT
ncbi:nuclear cap-binding protein subunit 1-like [Drosophila willistoni]|uniref:nuclear cap-binding protein subunit 1-like n=1 Tax=Drosophila willistoni TaxID=7260 RepID=UPI00017D8D00|nr:nuclear cap-binding protein subunit 1-like [Drosophila willistoni]